jgi:hypothetical protein
MKKWMAGPALAGLIVISATVAEATAPAQEESLSEDDNGDVGLFGLIGLAGLAGLAGLKRREPDRRYAAGVGFVDSHTMSDRDSGVGTPVSGVHTDDEMGWGDDDPGYTETKSFFRTSEFWFGVLGAVAVLLAAYNDGGDSMTRNDGWRYATAARSA